MRTALHGYHHAQHRGGAALRKLVGAEDTLCALGAEAELCYSQGWMTARMMQQVSATMRPLSFEASGSKTVLLESASTPWAGLQFEVHRTVPGELCDAGPPDGENALVVNLEGSIEMAIRKGPREFTFRSAPGSTSFLSGSHPSSARVTGSSVVAVVNLVPEWFHRVGLDRSPAGFGRMAPLAADQTMHALLDTMRQEVASGACTGRLYGESLSLALMSYVVDRIPASRLRVRGGLSEAQGRRLAKYIRERLGEDLALTELAAFVQLGPRQFSESFRNAFGITPHRYVVNHRLDEAARRLASGSLEIAEIALVLGFSSQSHFAAAFRKRFGETPRQYALARRRSTIF